MPADLPPTSHIDKIPERLYDYYNYVLFGQEVVMAYYLQLLNLTDKGRKNFEENPEWIREVDKEIELLGAKILTQYALLGQFDFVNIIEAPGDEVAAKLAIKLSAKGTIQPMTLAAIPLESLISSLKKGAQAPW